jgi:hypothetical protein
MPQASSCDVVVSMHRCGDSPRFGATGRPWYESPSRDDSGVPALTVWRSGSKYQFAYGEGARFVVDDSGPAEAGHVSPVRVDGWWTPPLSDADASDYLLGGVLAFVGRLRGMVPLHASAVVRNGRAIVFTGGAWAGKSSMATAFATLGFAVLSDDVVAIADRDGRLMAHPGRVRLSLWSDSAATLCARSALPLHSATYPKHRLDLDDCGYVFHDEPVEVEAVYVLASRSTRGQGQRRLSPRAALITLAANTYGNGLLAAAMRAREFDLLARLAGRAPVWELSMSDRLEDLVGDCRVLVE